MTWHAQRGETVLKGDEAEIFRTALDEMSETIRFAEVDDESFVPSGPSIYNRMTRSQQAASLEAVVKALFNATDEPFPLTAWSESTLAAILGTIRVSLYCEIEEGESSELRHFLNSRIPELSITLNSPEWNSIAEWGLLFDVYEEQFLWDLDYENDGIVDCSPETSRFVGRMMGVDQEYHTAIPPDLPCDEELALHDATIVQHAYG